MFRNTSVYTMLTALILALMTHAGAQTSLTDLVKAVKPAVVMVTTYDSTGRLTGQASGFFIAGNQVVTNYHVVDGAARLKIKTVDGSTYAVAKVLAFDQDNDIAIMQITSPPSTITPLRISSTLPSEGERILVVGSPEGLASSVSDGLVSAIRQDPGVGYIIQFTAPVSAGSSGSPLVNMRGEVVGVVVAEYRGGQNLNFAIPATQILALQAGGTPAREARGPSSEAALRNGIDLMVKGNFAGALSIFQNVVRADRSNYVAWTLMGHSYLGLDNYSQALYAFRQAIQLQSEYAPAYTGAGMALIGLRNIDTAQIAFERAIALDPEDALAHYGIGMIYVMKGDRTSALQEYQVLRDLDPDLANELFSTIYSSGKKSE